MKLNKDFVVQEIGDEQILVPIGGSSFYGVAKSNKTAAFIIHLLENEVTEDAIVEEILNTYEVTKEQAAVDVHEILDKLRGIGAIVE